MIDQNLRALEDIARLHARILLKLVKLAFPGMNAGVMARALLLEEEQNVGDLSPIEKNGETR